MKKLESTWYNMVIVLTVIALIAGVALASVNSLTSGPIAALCSRRCQTPSRKRCRPRAWRRSKQTLCPVM